MHFVEFSSPVMTGRVYDNGVAYTQDNQTNKQQWSIPTDTGGMISTTQFANGQVTSVQYNPGLDGGLILDGTSDNIQQYLQQQILSLPETNLTPGQQALLNGYQTVNNAIANDPNAGVTVAADGSISVVSGTSTFGVTDEVTYQYATNSSGEPVGLIIMSGPGAGQTYLYSSASNAVFTAAQADEIIGQMVGNLKASGDPIGAPGSIIPAGYNDVMHATVVLSGSVTPVAEVTLQAIPNSGAEPSIVSTYYYPQTGDTVQTVDTTINGDAVSVTYTYAADGTLIAHVNSINGQPPLNQNATDAAFGQTSPGELTSGNAPSANIAGAITANDASHPNGFQALTNALSAAGDVLSATGDAITSYAPPLMDALSLIQAVKSGQPLPVVASGLRILNDFTSVRVPNNPNNPNGATHLVPTNASLAGVNNAASGIMSLMSLDAALKNGDTGTAIVATAQTISYSANAYVNFATGNAVVNQQLISKTFETTGAAINSLNKALPYLSIANSIAKGDAKGTALAVLSMFPATAPFAMAYQAFQLISSVFGDNTPPEAWGNAKAVWDGGVTVVNANGGEGGMETASNTYNYLLGNLENILAYYEQQNPGFQLGIVANRLPTLSFRDYSGYQISDIDPLTGVQINGDAWYDRSLNLYKAAPGNDLPRSLANYFVESALSREAIAPQWEVDTAALQTTAGDPMAGLSEAERAGRQGLQAKALDPNATTQSFRPVGLDLNGNGQIDTAGAPKVGFNVDDGGYIKATPWLAKGADAWLTLDRNFNGQIDSGSELFSNALVDVSLRGLQGMKWVDANYDGKLTSADPVWGQIKVWKDANGDGVSFIDANNNGQYDFGEVSELKTLSELGISELNFSMGTFTQNGKVKKMASPDLAADTFGSRLSAVQGGILVEDSDGHAQIVVTQVNDLSAVEANRDGLPDGYEEVPFTISKALLLQNDSLAGISGANPVAGQYLDIVAVSAISGQTHGRVEFDANGDILYTPDHNYFGAVQFKYTLQASTGQQATATVEFNLANVNDPPVVTVDQHIRQIYGYDAKYVTVWDSRRDDYVTKLTLGTPHYQPYSGFDAMSGTTGLHNTVLSEVDIDGPNVGSLIVTDPDGDTGFTYQVTTQSLAGQGTVDANGNFSYENWSAPNTPGTVADGSKYVGRDNYVDTFSTQIDPFKITVTDAGGKSAVVNIDAVHTGGYSADLGSGGKKPISIDLGNDGFGFTNVNDSNVFFDINNDGFKHRVAWPSASDGLLAFDANGDGIIDNGSEISFAGYLSGAQTDLEGLSAFDSNKDGVFSALDERWSKFGIWQDANQNGITDAGEFKSLGSMGVASVGLTSNGQFSVVNGQTVHGVGTVTMSDGRKLNMADVTLAYSGDVLVKNPDGSNSVAIKSPFAPLETITGTAGEDLLLGNNGNTIINALDGNDVVFADIGNDVIDAGAGNDMVYAGSGNDFVIAGTGNDVVFAGVGNDIILAGDGHDAVMGEQGNDIVFAGDGNDFVSGDDGNDLLSGDAGDDQLLGGAGNDVLFGGDGNDELFGMDGYDSLNGGSGNDLLDGGAGADAMEGGLGDDTYVVNDVADTVLEAAGAGIDTVQSSVSYSLSANVENLTLLGGGSINATGNAINNVLRGNTASNVLDGGAGNDTLAGGRGNDTLKGGTGNDLYLFNPGDGADTIVDASGLDILLIGGNLTEANLEGFRIGNDMLINVLGTTDSITLKNWFVQAQGVRRVEFADGSFLNATGIDNLLNRPPVANPDDVMTDEDTARTTISIASLLANDTDPNTGDVIRLSGFDAVSALGNTVKRDANGNLVYDIGQRYQSLAQGQTVIDTFGYTISDRRNATDSTLVSMTITGVNDAPVTTADDATALQEDVTLTATGNVLSNDSDVDQGTVLQVANAGVFVGQFGTLTLNADGSYEYVLDNASYGVQSLAEGQVVTDVFDYAATDGLASTPSTLTVSITGTNDAPVVVADTNAVQEDVTLTATGNVLSNDSDIDQGTVLQVANAGVFVGQFGTLTLNADGSYEYALDNSSYGVQSLAQGQVVTDTFDYAATDGIASTPSILTVSITGTNDAPVVVADVNAVQEEVTLTATGNVLSNDNDIDQGTVLQVANAGVFVGQFGTLTLNADGSYEYVLDNASYGVQSLAEGQVVTDTFDYAATDGIASTPSTLTVSITGTNDAPVVVVPLTDASTLEDQPFSYQVPADTFTDIDQGDMLSYSATLADGTALPDWLKFDATTQTFSGLPSNWDVGLLNVSVTATDLHGATATSTFSLDIQNVNDAPIVVAHLADQQVAHGKRFSIVVPDTTFDDWDIVHGDSLSYSATLANGEELPKWLKFDAATRTFSGKAEGSDNLSILLTATDQAGARVTQAFTLGTGKGEHDGKHDKKRDDEHDHPTVIDTTQDEIIVSSSQNDIIHTGNGADSIVFGRGDGQDTVYGGVGTDNTLILTDGIGMADIALSKHGNDLVLETGASDQLTLRNWYDSTANYKSVLTLDIISSAVTEFDCKSKSGHKSDHHEVKTSLDQYDFGAVVAAFDQAWAADSTIQSWNAAQNLAVAHVDDDEDAALGSPAFKEMSIASLLALGQKQDLMKDQMNLQKAA